MEGQPRELLTNQVRVGNHDILLAFHFIQVTVRGLQTEQLIPDGAALRFSRRVGQRNPILVVRFPSRYLARQIARQQQVTTTDIDHGAPAVGFAVDVGDIHRNLIPVERGVFSQRLVLLGLEGDAEDAVIIGFEGAVRHVKRFGGGMPPVAAPPRERGAAGHAVAHRGTVERVTRQCHRTALHRHFLPDGERFLRHFDFHLERRQLVLLYGNRMAEPLVVHVSINMEHARQTAFRQGKLTRNGSELIGSQLDLLHLLVIRVSQRDLDWGVGEQDRLLIFIDKLENPLEINRLSRTVKRPIGEKVGIDTVF